MGDGAYAIPGPLAGEAEAEVRVMVDGVDVQGLGELARGSRPLPAHVQRSSEGLTDRALPRLGLGGSLQDDDGLMRMAGRQELLALLVEAVDGLAHGLGSRLATPSSIQGGVVAVAPFDGLLYDPAVVGGLASVTSPPYDVVLPHEQDRLHRASPWNIALVDLGAAVTGAPDEKYTRAGELLRTWREDNALVSAGQPAVYPYEMRFAYRGTRRRVRGVILQVELEPWGGAVLPHEQTMAAPVEDRLRVLKATRADLSPIYAVVGGPSDPQTALLERTTARPADRELVDEEGVEHRLWVEEADGSLSEWYRDQTLLIADGHHRYQTALVHRDEMRAAHGPGPWDSVMMLVVDAATEEPPVLPIHRVVRGVPAVQPSGERVRDLEEILARLVDDDLTYGAAQRTDEGLIHLVGRLQGEAPTVVALHRAFLDGAELEELRFVPDAALAEADVREGHADLALFLPPARVESVHAVVASGGRLPQKSTYFWPKPRTGMVIRPLD